MDQDMSHRIVAPSSAAAGAPRYSLVWKTVWFPRDDPTLPPDVHLRLHADAQNAPAPTDNTSRSPTSTTLQGLCRPEWGDPVRLGSAAQAGAVAAWKPR